MSKRNVLVFSAGVYPAIQIYYCLQHSMMFHPIGASSYSNHSKYVFKDHVDDLPFVFDPEFITKLNNLIEERNIEFVIPTDDTIAYLVMKNKERIKAVLVCSPYETALLCRYKSKTYEKLKYSSYVPDMYKDPESVKKYPIFAKPDEGQGSQGAFIINNQEEFYSSLKCGKGMVYCEYLGGEEVTVDCFTNKDRKLLFINPRKRTRVLYGVSVHGEMVPLSDEVSEIVKDLNEKIEFRGYWFVQLKRNEDGQFKLLEICTRFAGTFGLSKALGVNLPLLALCDFAGMEVSITPNDYLVSSDKTFIDRYELNMEYERVYIDYDDTITCDGGNSVNSFMLAYLYQCRARKRKVILVTRHEGSVLEDLKRFCIAPEIFDEIHELSWNQEKVDVMDNNVPCIFIDNSYAERAKVQKALGIPVFDAANIDCLLDWR